MGSEHTKAQLLAENATLRGRLVALADQVAHLAIAQHTTHVGSWAWNIRTDAMLFSEEMCRLLGVTREAEPPTYAVMLTHVHPEDRARYEAALQEALAANTLYRLEHRIVRPDQASVVVLSQGQGYCDATGTPVRMVGTMQDISEHTQAAQALQESEVRYRRLFQSAQDGILLLDADTGHITDVNPYLEMLLGYAHTELVGKTLWDIGAFKDIATSQLAFRQLQANTYIRYENLPLATKAGEHKQVEFVSNVYLVEDTPVIQCNIRDITLRKQAEAEVQKTHEALLALVPALQKRDQEMQLLNHMHDLLQACTTQSEAYQVTAQLARELFAEQNGCFAIFHGEERYLEVVARWGDEVLVEPIFPLEHCWAMRRGQLHEVFGPHTGMLCQHFLQPPQGGHVCVPLTIQGETLGVL